MSTNQPLNKSLLASLTLAVLLLSGTPGARADVRLPQVFANHMVLQHGQHLPVWGWAEPNESVTVQVAGQTQSTKANANGEWRVTLEPLSVATAPISMTVTGRNVLTFDDVLVGDVWFCSGQSNMAMILRDSADGPAEAAKAEHPNIRIFTTFRKASGIPLEDTRNAWPAPQSTWARCNPKTALHCSAVSYYFARHLREELGEKRVPIGLIVSAWGGTRIAPWIAPEGFAKLPSLQRYVEQIAQANEQHRERLAAFLPELRKWTIAAEKALAGATVLPAAPPMPKHPLYTNWQPSSPTALFNGMVRPFVPYGIRGVLWYQGENNVMLKEGMVYRDKMEALIHGWRHHWGRENLPFYFVQIAPFEHDQYKPGQLPRLWEAQLAAMKLPHTGMAVIHDLADLEDVHPRQKAGVGRRLALWALAKTYGRSDLVFSGPLYDSMSVTGNTVSINFVYGDGLKTRDGKAPDWFAIAGADKAFHHATAEIDGNKIVLRAKAVPEPIAVRYAWDRAAMPNLINAANLPASPFRTDQW